MRVEPWLCRTVLAGALICLPGGEAAGQFDAPRQVEVYSSKRSFFMRSAFGTLALLPNVTSRSEAAFEFEFITLPTSGLYSVPRGRGGTGDWWFLVNHRSGSGASEVHTYVGILIAKRLERPLANSLQLMRNAGWRELDGVDLGSFENTYPSWTEFFDLQDADASRESFTEAFGDWHALPDPRADESSWLHRNNWLNKDSVDRCFQSTGEPPSSDSNIFFQARLIRFRVTTSSNSQSPVAWNVGLRDADAFYMRTFSPEGIDLHGEYCVGIG